MNLLWDGGGGHRKEEIYHSLDVSVLLIEPWGLRLAYAQPIFIFVIFEASVRISGIIYHNLARIYGDHGF